jgi:hypothetical protein
MLWLSIILFELTSQAHKKRSEINKEDKRHQLQVAKTTEVHIHDVATERNKGTKEMGGRCEDCLYSVPLFCSSCMSYIGHSIDHEKVLFRSEGGLISFVENMHTQLLRANYMFPRFENTAHYLVESDRKSLYVPVLLARM